MIAENEQIRHFSWKAVPKPVRRNGKKAKNLDLISKLSLSSLEEKLVGVCECSID